MTGVKSNKQRRAELKARRKKRSINAARRLKEDLLAFRIAVGPPEGAAPVNALLLAMGSSYATPTFVKRGYYLDVPFVCRDCGKDEVWTATQQKWWYEIAKGGVETNARRCRPCRRRERERAADQKKRTEDGIERKARLKAAGKWRTGL